MTLIVKPKLNLLAYYDCVCCSSICPCDKWINNKKNKNELNQILGAEAPESWLKYTTDYANFEICYFLRKTILKIVAAMYYVNRYLTYLKSKLS